MTQTIIYPNADTVIVMGINESCGLTTDAIAQKDVPTGVPYIICDSAELPSEPQETWVVDWTNPTGYGA